MVLRLSWIACVLMLQACAEPKFEFRGYTDLSSCTEVIDAELANGSRYQGVFDAEDSETPGSTIELSGELFSEDVRIDVTCTAGRITSIHYISQASDPRETGALWALFSQELGGLFGEPTEIFTDEGRSRRFLCHSPSPVLLEEWRLETEDDEDPAHEIYLAIVPEAAECLDPADR